MLWFAPSILAQPPRAGKRRNLANVIKKRIDLREHLNSKIELEGAQGGIMIETCFLLLSTLNWRRET